jgi:hypothetical protein
VDILEIGVGADSGELDFSTDEDGSGAVAICVGICLARSPIEQDIGSGSEVNRLFSELVR